MSNKDEIKKNASIKDDNLDIEDLRNVSGGSIIEGLDESEDDATAFRVSGFVTSKRRHSDGPVIED